MLLDDHAQEDDSAPGSKRAHSTDLESPSLVSGSTASSSANSDERTVAKRHKKDGALAQESKDGVAPRVPSAAASHSAAAAGPAAADSAAAAAVAASDAAIIARVYGADSIPRIE
jgi:hypothetical protein